MPHLSFDARAILQAKQSIFTRYGAALFLVAVAVALRTWLDPIIGHPSVAIFMAAILGGAWFGGVGPALVCLVLLHLVHGYWFQTPSGLWEPNLASIVTIFGWYVVGITAGILSQMRTAAHARAYHEQMEAASQREQLRTSLLCMADGVLLIDCEGRLSLMNPAAETLTGWSVNEATGKLWSDVLSLQHEERQEAVASPIDRVLRDSRVVHSKLPMVLASRSRKTFPIAYSAAPVKAIDGRVSAVVLVFRDESERRRNELALQNADRRKNEFLAVLGHELRNPLAPICVGLELLKESAANPQELEEVRSMMQRQAEHMVRLIDDLLDVSRITRGRLELRKTEVDLADIVRDAIASTRPLLDAACHQLEVRMPEKTVMLYADAHRLTQILTNLLNNAAKYTPREGHIQIAIEHTGAEVTLTVADSGIGISADKLDGVFDLFTQIDERHEYGQPGLGIGLALVKRLVEMHGGSVAIQSSGQNLGTTVTVRLPTLSGPHAKVSGEAKHVQNASASVKRRVLIVDDHADVLDSLSRLVRSMGHEVGQARDGQAALDVGRVFLPEIVLMDLGMPNLNGYDAARLIRQEPWGRHVTLVATTGWGQDEDRRSTAKAGFDRHLVKPVTTAALREVLGAPALCTDDDSLCCTASKNGTDDPAFYH